MSTKAQNQEDQQEKIREETSSKDRPTSRLITEVHTSEENTRRELANTAQAMDIKEIHINDK